MLYEQLRRADGHDTRQSVNIACDAGYRDSEGVEGQIRA